MHLCKISAYGGITLSRTMDENKYNFGVNNIYDQELD